MSLPRDLSGPVLARALCARFGYAQVHQSGSHILLDTQDPTHHRLAIPAHKSLRIGALNSILRADAAHRGVSRSDLLDAL